MLFSGAAAGAFSDDSALPLISKMLQKGVLHDALTKESDIVDQYIIPCYETLHTQGKEYIVENLKEVMAERGIVV